MAKALTEVAIRNVRPGNIRREIPDALLPGLYFICQPAPSGARSWCVRFRRPDGRTAKLTLGSWPAITLAKARELGRDALIAAKSGRDPITDRKAARDKAEAGTRNTLRNVAEKYLARESKKLRTADQRQSVLERLVYPKLGSRQIGSITRSELVSLLDDIEDKNGPRAADVTLAIVRKIMNWHSVRDETFRTPIVRGMQRVKAKDTARARILNDDELRAVWKAAVETETPFAALVRFLLLTAARRGEAAEMKWTELEDGSWCLPAERNKTKQELCRPLSKAAQAALDELPHILDCDHVFTTDGKRPVSGFSKFKRAFDEQCGVTGWTLHDLRRTARSLMSRAGVPSDHAERALGHVIAGVRGVYDRHEYRDEMLMAFEKLAAVIANIVSPQEKVTPLRRR
jgi:integrase